MALPTTFSVGTATINANETTVTGQGTTWLTSGIQAGDLFWAAGLSARIAAVNSNTSLTLAFPWPGATRTGAAYEIRFTPDATRVLASSRAVLDAIGGGSLFALGQLQTSQDKLPYSTGAGTWGLTTLTPFARTLLDDADAATACNTLGALPKSGGAMSGRLSTSTSGTGDSPLGTSATGLGEIEVTSNGVGAAMIAFHRPGKLAHYFGLDTDNEMKIGGWSLGATSYRVRTDRNFAPLALFSAGGNEADLSTGETVRLQITFTATGPTLMASAALALAASAATDVIANFRLGDNVNGTYVVTDARAVSVDGLTGIAASMAFHLAASGLIVGRSYVLQIGIRKANNAGSVLPKSMSISGINL